MVSKIQDSGKFHLRIAFTNYYIYTNQFHFKTEKPLQKPETSIKDGLKKRELEFPSGTFHLEKQDYLNFRCSVAPEKFSSGTRKRQVPLLLSNQIFWKL